MISPVFRRKSSSEADGDVQGTVCLDGTDSTKRTPDQRVEIKDQKVEKSSTNSLKLSDRTSTSPDIQSQRESSGPVEMEEMLQPEAVSSDATRDVAQDTEDQKCEEKNEETQPSQQPVITAEQAGEDSDKRASGNAKEDVVKDQLPSPQTEVVNPQPAQEQEATGEETSLQQVQVSEDRSSPSTQSSGGSSPHDPPTRTESMNSGAMLLPTEL